LIDEQAKDKIKEFFQQELLPQRNHLGKVRGNFFATRFDRQSPTYFRDKEQGLLQPAEMEGPECRLPAELEQKLAEMWEGQGYPELAALAPALARLAELLQAGEEPDAEVSPLIYVMF
jgi:hypothetical protein